MPTSTQGSSSAPQKKKLQIGVILTATSLLFHILLILAHGLFLPLIKHKLNKTQSINKKNDIHKGLNETEEQIFPLEKRLHLSQLTESCRAESCDG